MIDRESSTLPPARAVEAAAAAGVDWFQIRDRKLETRELLAFAEEISRAARRAAGERAIRILVNRRIDVALASGADGAHLGFDALPIDAARALLGKQALIGVSTHRVEEVASAARDGASYVHLAPIHPPLSKRSERPPLGLEAVTRAAELGIPVFAQGGVGARHCGALIRAGAAGVAVTGAILMREDPGAAAAELRRQLDLAVD